MIRQIDDPQQKNNIARDILYALPVLISLNRVRILIWSFWNGDRYTSSGTELVNAVKP